MTQCGEGASLIYGGTGSYTGFVMEDEFEKWLWSTAKFSAFMLITSLVVLGIYKAVKEVGEEIGEVVPRGP